MTERDGNVARYEAKFSLVSRLQTAGRAGERPFAAGGALAVHGIRIAPQRAIAVDLAGNLSACTHACHEITQIAPAAAQKR